MVKFAGEEEKRVAKKQSHKTEWRDDLQKRVYDEKQLVMQRSKGNGQIERKREKEKRRG